MATPKLWYRKQTKSYYVKIDGKQVNLGKDKHAAREQYNRLIDGNVGRHTVREILDFYWRWLKKNRRPSTYESRERLLKTFGESVPANLKAVSLKPHHVQAWLDDNERPLSDTTKNYRITTIVGVFSWAKMMGYLDRNPIAGMPKPKRTVRQEFLPAEVFPQLLESASDERFRDWLTVMLATGARTEEMFKLEAEHFDGEKFVLPIEDSKGRRKSRTIYIPEPALAVVKRLVKKHSSGPFLLNTKGSPWNRNSINCRFKRLKEVMGMPKLCATVLRHSFAHHRLTSGQDALTVAKLMGHVDTSMIASRYGHLDANTDYMKTEANRIAIPSLLPTSALDSPPVVSS